MLTCFTLSYVFKRFVNSSSVVCEIYVILTTRSSPFTLGNCRQIFCQIDFKKKMSVQHSVVPVFCPFPVNQMYVIVEAAQFFHVNV